MRVERYSNLLRGVAGLMGFSVRQLNDEEFYLWSEAINAAARFGWEFFNWPNLGEIVEVEAGTVNYNADTGFVRTSRPDVFETTVPAQVVAVYSRDPREARNPANAELRFRVWEGGEGSSDTGVILQPSGRPADKVWVHLKRPFIDYRGPIFREELLGGGKPELALHAGLVVYGTFDLGWGESLPKFERPGDWFHVATPISDPEGNPYSGSDGEPLPGWNLVRFPWFLSGYVVPAAAAQILETEGRPQQAGVWRGKAEAFLEQSLDLVLDQNEEMGKYLGPHGGVPRGPRGFRG